MKLVLWAALLYGLNLFSAIGVIYYQYENRRLFAELQVLEQRADQLAVEFGQLQLEQSTWATHGRIEEVARSKLNMYVPPYETIEFIQPELL